MWGRLKQWITRQQVRLANETLEFLDVWELSVTQPGILDIRPSVSKLSARMILDLRDRLREDETGKVDQIRVDFSNVSEFIGPWGIHFAVLIDLYRRFNGRLVVTGLQSKPASMAWLLRRSSEIRAITQMADDTPTDAAPREREAA